MKKIFISQPMARFTGEQILKQRDNAINVIKELFEEDEKDIVVLNSYFEDYNPTNGCIPLKYLAKSLGLLADADILVCIGNWESVRECRIERECAKEYGIDIIYLRES